MDPVVANLFSTLGVVKWLHEAAPYPIAFVTKDNASINGFFSFYKPNNRRLGKYSGIMSRTGMRRVNGCDAPVCVASCLDVYL
jgi:hypothetical protein